MTRGDNLGCFCVSCANFKQSTRTRPKTAGHLRAVPCTAEQVAIRRPQRYLSAEGGAVYGPVPAADPVLRLCRLWSARRRQLGPGGGG